MRDSKIKVQIELDQQAYSTMQAAADQEMVTVETMIQMIITDTAKELDEHLEFKYVTKNHAEGVFMRISQELDSLLNKVSSVSHKVRELPRAFDKSRLEPQALKGRVKELLKIGDFPNAITAGVFEESVKPFLKDIEEYFNTKM